MSLGYGGWAILDQVNEDSVIYKYGSYNWNEEEYRNEDHICDGTIIINKRSFKEPEIHIKKKRMPSGRKREVIKRIPVKIDIEEHIATGDIQVEKSSNCWKEYNGVDVSALRIIDRIMTLYQLEGEYPKEVGYLV